MSAIQTDCSVAQQINNSKFMIFPRCSVLKLYKHQVKFIKWLLIIRKARFILDVIIRIYTFIVLKWWEIAGINRRRLSNIRRRLLICAYQHAESILSVVMLKVWFIFGPLLFKMMRRFLISYKCHNNHPRPECRQRTL